MNFSRHSKKFPAEMSEYFASAWSNRELWHLQLQADALPIQQLEWHLNYPFWSSEPPAPLFDLRPRTVLESPQEFPRRWERVLKADTQFPILVARFGELIVILDGHHRLVKSISEGASEVQSAFVPRGHLRLVA